MNKRYDLNAPVSKLGLDFETYGSRNLNDVGLDNYTSDPKFKPLLAAVAFTRVNHPLNRVYDFVLSDRDLDEFSLNIVGLGSRHMVAAHNKGFERTVLRKLGITLPWLVDTAVASRCAGGSSKLAKAAMQLADHRKMDEGTRLIKLFCTGPEAPTVEFVMDHLQDWGLFKEYCLRDAQLSVELAENFDWLINSEFLYDELTASMNDTGWFVDTDLVRRMQEQYLINCDNLRLDFQKKYDPQGELNLDSLKQLKEWCGERGIKAKSFNKENVDKMHDGIVKRLGKMAADDPRREGYEQVVSMLKLKQELGGSSLTKLPKILALTGEDSRLRHQYMHAGAGQSFRTSGTGVQMQNLHRLSHPRDVATLYTEPDEWTNDVIAENIRQVFMAEHPQGELIVCDLSSIESRGLAYLAGEDWKITEYHNGKDMYRVLGAKIYGKTYDEVSKDSEERRTGKVGELACGYGAGAGAVQAFAEGMGITMTEDEAGTLVKDWRDVDPKIVQLWADINDMLHRALSVQSVMRTIGNDMTLHVTQIRTPDSLKAIHPGAQTLEVELYNKADRLVVRRVLQGVYRRGNDLNYYKPGETVNGPPWKATYRNPKTKQEEFHKIYGGKMTGILTQSFCRELFFVGMQQAFKEFEGTGVKMIGQFHDELVAEWDPTCTISLEEAQARLLRAMTDIDGYPWFPFAAEVKHAHRYIK